MRHANVSKAVALTVARNATGNIAMIDLKTFSIGCVLSLMISSLVIWLMTFLDPDEIFIIRYGKIHPYFAIIFVVVINLYVGLDTTTKDLVKYVETIKSCLPFIHIFLHSLRYFALCHKLSIMVMRKRGLLHCSYWRHLLQL